MTLSTEYKREVEVISTAYVLTAGEYSDYRILAIFTSRADAEEQRRFLAALINDEVEISEFQLNSVKLFSATPIFKVSVDWEGKNVCFEDDPEEDLVGQVGLETLEIESHLSDASGPKISRAILTCVVQAGDEEHAKKIVLDKLYRRKAMEEGVS